MTIQRLKEPLFENIRLFLSLRKRKWTIDFDIGVCFVIIASWQSWYACDWRAYQCGENDIVGYFYHLSLYAGQKSNKEKGLLFWVLAWEEKAYLLQVSFKRYRSENSLLISVFLHVKRKAFWILLSLMVTNISLGKI